MKERRKNKMLKKQFLLFTMFFLCVFRAGVNAQMEKEGKKFTYFSLFTSVSVQHNYFVYTDGQKWGKERTDTDFKENFYNLSVFKDNGTELDLFYRNFEAKSVFIAGGFWDTKKAILGMSIGKVLTAEIKIPLISVSLPIDFSGGPYVTFGIDNKYDFVSGNKDMKVSDQEDPIIGFGIYTNIRLRIKFSQNRKYPSLTAGLKYFIPFNDFEYNPEKENVSYRLERKFFYIGISF
jgi:hypothetical protein